MPGIAIAAGPSASRALAAMARDGWAQTQLAIAPEGVKSCIVAPPAYPVLVVESHAATAVLEGAVYATPAAELRETIGGFSREFAADPRAARAAVERWAAVTDGDFVVVVIAGDGSKALIVNDRLGRLPLYWSSRSGNAAVAREIKAVRAVCGAGDVDRSALGQMLLFSFPLGTRTLHAEIRRVPEASSALIDAAGTIDLRRYAQWNFQTLQSADGPRAEELAERFSSACAAQAAWAQNRPIVLGLSGGLDSRAVGAALSRAGARYATITFVTGRKKAAEETETSKRIAAALGVPWEELRLAPPSWEDERRMAVLRDGTSNVALAFMADYFAKLAERFGADAVHFTGDGGDRALPDLRADVPIRTREDFLRYRLANALLTPADAAALVGLSPERLVDDIREHFAGYPEEDPAVHNVRFMIADWAMCRLFCGEDRNRSFLWSMTPFYAQSFFEAAMRAPQSHKRHYRLYAEFLRVLDPRVVRVPKSNWGYAVDSPMVRWNAWRDALTAAVLVRFKRERGAPDAVTSSRGRYGTSEHDPGFAALARAHNGAAFDPQRLRALSERGLDKLQYHMLATAVAYIEHIWGSSAEGNVSVPLPARPITQ